MQKLERELDDARQSAQRAVDKAAEIAEHLRISKEDAERAKSEGTRTATDLKRQARELNEWPDDARTVQALAEALGRADPCFSRSLHARFGARS